MTTKHTPGPWEVDASGYRAPNGELCVMAGNLCVAVVGADSDKPQAENAHLIAASPDLLEAIQWAMLYVPYPHAVGSQDYAEGFAQKRNAALRAIAKATGEQS